MHNNIIDGATYTPQEAFDFLKNRQNLLLDAIKAQNEKLAQLTEVVNTVVTAINRAAQQEQTPPVTRPKRPTRSKEEPKE